MRGTLLLRGRSRRNDRWAIILILTGGLVANVVRQGSGLCVMGGGGSDRSLFILRAVSESIVVV